MTRVALRSSSDVLEELLRLVGSSIVRYAVEGAGAEVRNDADRDAYRLYEEWLRAEAEATAEARRILESDGVFPSRATWPLWFSQLNYVGARFLLGHVVPHMEGLRDALRELASLQGASTAVPLLDQVIHMEEGFIERAREMLGA